MPLRKCSHCDAEFTVAYNSTKRKSCSDECRRALFHRKKPGIRRDAGIRKATWITVTCEYCRNQFEKAPHKARLRELRGYKHYCSWQCRDANAGANSGRPASPHRTLTEEGYYKVYVPPSERPDYAKGRARHLEHRVVMARLIGRPLMPYETVHHINGDRTDNRAENLQLRIGKHGTGAALCCRSCGSTDIVGVELSGVDNMTTS